MSCEYENTPPSDGQEGGGAPLTCSVRDFARIAGISRDAAYELANSIDPPPGFTLGRSYRVIVSRIPEYLDALAERETESRLSRLRKRPHL